MNNKKVNIKICSGTACYVLGGADFLLLKEEFAEEELKNISFEISNCLDLCKEENSESPYVLINDKLFANARKTNIISEVKKILNS